jgi:hypothetical protein
MEESVYDRATATGDWGPMSDWRGLFLAKGRISKDNRQRKAWGAPSGVPKAAF